MKKKFFILFRNKLLKKHSGKNRQLKSQNNFKLIFFFNKSLDVKINFKIYFIKKIFDII